MASYWPQKNIKVSSLLLDVLNPRLTRDGKYESPRDIIRYLFEHEDTMQVAQSIATRGFFPTEPLLAIKVGNAYTIVEGNRRLAALKAILSPDLLDGKVKRAVEKLAIRAQERDLSSVPVVIAPNRRLTDKLLAGRHIGTPVKAWDAANRAAFILEKLNEGYDAVGLRDELGFSEPDIRSARKTDAIAKLIKSVSLPSIVRERVDNPNSKVLSTVERVVDSTVGRKLLMLEPDGELGVRGTTSKQEFLKGFTRLLTDIAAGNATSRKLNSNADIGKYFESIGPDRPIKKGKGFVPAEIYGDRTKKEDDPTSTSHHKKPGKTPNRWVVPKSFKVRYGAERLVHIRSELTALDRKKFPNAGAILLRVFLELSMVDYLGRAGKLKPLVDRLKADSKQHGLKNGIPVMRELRKEFTKIAKASLESNEAITVEKALRHDASAPFGVDDLHSFVHQLSEFPGDKEINTFWNRMQSLFCLMLEQPAIVE
jgi:hypothetical protein